jgi:tetraacyldisaccharide 4'-kinase
MNKKQILFFIGRPFSPFYSLLMRFRAFLYRVGIWRVIRLDVPVVSIGNLTMGGSGKTPVVQYIARFLQNNGCNPAVISRGYGGSAKERVNLVSDGINVLLDAPVAGDEPRFLADTLPGIPVLTGAVRKYPAARAVELGADVLVLDDGFQHMAMARDLDLVLFNADFLAGNSTVFPGGDLREPVKALNRCHGFVITGISGRNNERAEKFADLLRSHFPDHPVFFARYQPTSILCRENGGTMQVMSLDALNDLRLFGFSGIAHPERFKETLTEMGLNISGFLSFADHYIYKEEDLKNIFLQASQLGANGCIATEKDMVKLALFEDGAIPLYALRMEVEFDSDFNEFLLTRVNGL